MPTTRPRVPRADHHPFPILPISPGPGWFGPYGYPAGPQLFGSIREIFQAFDRNSDRHLDARELKHAFECMVPLAPLVPPRPPRPAPSLTARTTFVPLAPLAPSPPSSTSPQEDGPRL